MEINVKTAAINAVLIVVSVLALSSFFSGWREIQKLNCGDINNHLHPSRRMIAGYDPNWYIIPAFEAWEFRDGLTVQRLRRAMESDGIVFPQAQSDLEALNALLKPNFLEQSNSARINPDRSSPWVGNTDDDRIHARRKLLELRYPLQCPRLKVKNDLLINQEPTFSNGPIQSASPFYLAAFYPLYALPAEQVKNIWFFLTWGLALASVGLLASCARRRDGPKLVWILGLYFIATSYTYHLHILRGQKYVLYTFLLSLAYFMSVRKSKDSLSGFVMGCLIMFRPNALLVAIPFWFARKWSFLGGVLGGVTIGIMLPAILSDLSVWKSYLAQGSSAGLPTESLLSAGSSLRYGNSYWDGVEDDVRQTYALKEICEPALTLTFSYIVRALAETIRSMPAFPKYKNIGLILASILLVLTACCWRTVRSWYFRLRQTQKVPECYLWLAGSWLFLFSNYFSTVNQLYTDVLWLFPLSLLLVKAESWSFSLKTNLALPVAIFLFFSSFGFDWFKIEGIGVLYGEVVMLFAIPFIIINLVARNRPLTGAIASQDRI